MPGPLPFLIARTLRDDAALQRLSVPQAALLAELAGKSVALVGNARALAGTDQGAAIDAHDIVARINRAPIPSATSHGRRIDWLLLATRLPAADRARLAPARILWMSHKRKRLDYATATSPGFYLHPLGDHAALTQTLGAPPSTGAMAVELLLRADLARLDLYGFDGFASKSLSGRREAEQVPHDFNAEAAWMAARAQADPRMTLHPPAA